MTIGRCGFRLLLVCSFLCAFVRRTSTPMARSAPTSRGNTRAATCKAIARERSWPRRGTHTAGARGRRVRDHEPIALTWEP